METTMERNQARPWTDQDLDERHLPQQVAGACEINPVHITHIINFLCISEFQIGLIAASPIISIGDMCPICFKGEANSVKRNCFITTKTVKEGKEVGNRRGFDVDSSYCARCRTFIIHSIKPWGLITPFEIFNMFIPFDPN
ncbi:MAG: hypothetical protein V3U15_01375 [Nitrospinota bacterium]